MRFATGGGRRWRSTWGGSTGRGTPFLSQDGIIVSLPMVGDGALQPPSVLDVGGAFSPVFQHVNDGGGVVGGGGVGVGGGH